MDHKMEENRFKEKMLSKSNEELNAIIANSHRYIPIVIEAALAELNRRGITVENSKSILEKSIVRQKEIYNDVDSGITYQQVVDEANLLLHSRKVIYIISAVLSFLIIVVSTLLSYYSLINSSTLFGIVLIVLGFCGAMFYKQIIRIQGPGGKFSYSIATRLSKLFYGGIACIVAGVILILLQ